MLFNLVIFSSVKYLSLLFYLIWFFYQADATDLRIREDSKLFVRFNLKINSVEYSKIFAHAIGFRVNFDLRKSKKPKRMGFPEEENTATYFHPDKVRHIAEHLFNTYGWNGTSCLVRTMCEISRMPNSSYDLIGPMMKLAFLGALGSDTINERFCGDAVNCPISILHVLSNDEFD